MADKKLTWHKAEQSRYPDAGSFLRKHEAMCVSACSRFIQGNFHVWTLDDYSGETAALLLYSHKSLYPVFNNNGHIPLPKFLNRFFNRTQIHSVQGTKNDSRFLEAGLGRYGCFAADSIDYNLMTLDKEPLPDNLNRGPPGLVIREAMESDMEKLLELHSAYEKEEVIPTGGYFNPDNSRKTLDRIFSNEQMMVACLGTEIIGKINTNAKSFTRRQIGGVYVRPEFRRLGVASRMSAVFLKRLISEGSGITLFVKTKNIAAANTYKRLGFTVCGDYRISYY